MNLGKRVKHRREQLSISQADLGAAIGASQESIAQLESRDSKSSRKITQLADALSCSVDWLTTGDESKNKNADQLKVKANKLLKDISEDELNELIDYKAFIVSKRKH